MREIQSSEAKTHLTQLLSEVARGESFTITRHGRPVAQLVPVAAQRRSAIESTMEQIVAFRRSIPALSQTDIASARHEGHRS
jgi:prevent-host-death family protein